MKAEEWFREWEGSWVVHPDIGAATADVLEAARDVLVVNADAAGVAWYDRLYTRLATLDKMLDGEDSE